MKIQFLGHATFRLEYGSSVLLIDPFLRNNPVCTLDFDTAIEGVTHVLVTHAHNDHMEDVAEVLQKTGAMLVTTVDLCKHFRNELGIKKAEAGNIGGEIVYDDFSVVFTQAAHSSSLGDPVGFIIKAGGEAVYHMGDTDIFSDMALIQEFHRPTVGLVPVGGRVTMDGYKAALTCERYFNFRHVIPMHYGGMVTVDPDPSVFLEAASPALKQKITVLDVGGTLDLGQE